ncbi:sigma-70 family RNA polymerase sigma factor [Planctomicrobium sp. SH664]|uniref:sigma-70 family RNA polymerase sigma factor n=1 Tax=Planctomicrobium sp. SH664 TaxID=3448125 RepID=UPI003F5B06D5
MNEPPSRISGLLEQARQGNTSARDELFQSCRNYLNLVARMQVESWMRTRVDASDLVQQTLLEAHRGFDKFAGSSEGEWLGWLKQMLTHNTQDFIRQQRTAKRGGAREIPIHNDSAFLGGIGLSQLHDKLPTPSQLLMARERELELADCVAELAPDYQEVLQLRSLQRLSFDEVAERMGRSRSATQMLWMRAVQKLEQMLSGREDP